MFRLIDSKRVKVNWCSVAMPIKYVSNKVFRSLVIGRLSIKVLRRGVVEVDCG